VGVSLRLAPRWPTRRLSFAPPLHRRVKLTNAKVREAIVEAHGAVDALRALGWVDDPEAPGEALVVQPGLYFSMKEVRVVEAAKERLRKEVRSASTKDLQGLVSVKA
jgi:hypothetical protein